MNPIHIGMIGLGRIGLVHYLNVSTMPDVVIDWICDLKADDTYPEQFPAAKKFTTDYREVLADPQVEAVLITASTDVHMEIAKAAALAGKAIFCEKPVGTDDAEILDVYHVVKETGTLFQTGFNRRYDHNFRRIAEARDAGTLGKGEVLKVTSRDPEPPSADYVKISGGIFMDMMIHDFDIVRYISGRDVKTVSVLGAVLVDPEIGKLGDIDTAIVTLEFEDGMIGMIDNSRRAAYGYDQRIELFGSKGVAVAGNVHTSTTVVATKDGVVGDVPEHFFLERYREAYRTEIVSFFDKVRNGGTPECTFEDGIKAIRLAQAALEALKTGQKVNVKPVE